MLWFADTLGAPDPPGLPVVVEAQVNATGESPSGCSRARESAMYELA